MITVDLSREDFEYLRLIVRARNNACAQRIQEISDFAEEAQTNFGVSDEVKVADGMIVSGMLIGLETMNRIDLALEEAVDAGE